MNDLYNILGVERAASPEEIKAAHRRLVKEHHPDKNGGETSQAFLDIQKAYEVLSNLSFRATYDEYGFTEADNQFSLISGLAVDVIRHCIKQGAPPHLIINKAEENLQESLAANEATKKGIEEELGKVAAHKAALKQKKKLKVDMFGQIIDGMIRQKEGDLANIMRTIETHEALLDLLDKYEKGEIPLEIKNTHSFLWNSFVSG